MIARGCSGAVECMDYMGWGGGRICCSKRHSDHHIDFGEVATGFKYILSVQLFSLSRTG
jgi:hypothetical protein